MPIWICQNEDMRQIMKATASPARSIKPVRVEPRALFLLATGYLFFAIGFVGMFLPVLPTTVFWIIAAFCFAKSSPAMYRRILAWPRVGPAIAAFIDHGVIGRTSKRVAIAGMSAGAALVLLVDMGLVPTAAALCGIAFAAIYVGTRPSDTVSS